MIKVTIKCFSQVKYALNQHELVLELKNGFRSSDLEKKIRIKAKGHLVNIYLRIAINQQYITKNTKLKDGDEVAFIPPVQGG